MLSDAGQSVVQVDVGSLCGVRGEEVAREGRNQLLPNAGVRARCPRAVVPGRVPGAGAEQTGPCVGTARGIVQLEEELVVTEALAEAFGVPQDGV